MGEFGFGVKLQRGDAASPEVFTDIAELINLGGPGLSLDTVEVTHTGSTNKYREYIAGLLDAGEVSAEVNFLPANATQNEAAGILKDIKDRTKRNFKIVFPDSGSATWSFAAFVTAFEPSAPIDDRMTASITLKLTGDPTLA